MNTLENVETTEDTLLDTLGEAELLQSIIKALDVETKGSIYAYICRMYDIETECEE